MRPFRFRPQAVLELRRREEETLQNALARQRAETARAYALVDAAAQTARAAAATLAATTAAGAAQAVLEWHRSWIGKLKRDLASCAIAATEAEQATARAAALLGKAVQRRRVLERLRERAWRRYRVESDREQLRDMDRLAGLRHFAQATDLGGEPHDACDRRERALPDVQPHAELGLTGHARPRRVPEPAGHPAPEPGPDPAAG